MILWPPHVKSWLIGKDSDAGRNWGQEEKGTTEYEMAGWHHRLNGHEFEWTPGVGNGQGGLACCNSWGRKESDMTEWLNWTEKWYRKLLTKTSEGGWRLTHLLVCVGLYILFQWVTNNRKVLPDPLSHIHIHLKITGLFWSFLLRIRNMSSSETHCCYIIIVSENHSVISNSLSAPWTVAHQAPLSMEFSRQEY